MAAAAQKQITSNGASSGLAGGPNHHLSHAHRCVVSKQQLQSSRQAPPQPGGAGCRLSVRERRSGQLRRGLEVVTHASAQQTSYAVSINPTQQAPAVLRQEPDPLTLMLGVCLAFWGVSATISAGIGVLMKLAGRPLAYASSRGGGSWTSTSVVDSDIMPLFLTYEDEQQPGAAAGVSRVPRDGTGVAYVPWTGPDSYIPVSMVKVFEPGMLEAGRVARPDMLTPDASTLSIVSVTRPADASLASKLPTNGNGGSNGNGSNGGSNGSSNGSSNGKSGGNGSRNPEQE